jgi:hypothetical protein
VHDVPQEEPPVQR